jgi:2-polyprenyl-6-methoxyphenol hydroxylase-like FAD-dependent oxidoreductase
MDKPHTPHVLVVGAGIGGLTAALSLHAAGIRTTVIESAREIRSLGVGINLQPHAVRELTELGLGDQLAATAIATAETVYVDRFGTRIFTEPRGRESGYHWPQYSVHRGELQALLLSAVRDRLGPDAVRTGTRLVDFEPTPDEVSARTVDRATGRRVEMAADVLVGADGVNSVVRARSHPGEGPLLWSGVRMWRGVTEAEPMLTGRSMVIAHDERGAQFLAYPISRRAAEQGRALLNWVAMVQVAAPGPLPQSAGWNRAVPAADVLPHFVDWTSDWFDVPGLVRASAGILEYPMVDRDPLPAWGEGRVTLLGDAAHPMYPVGANGASQAIVDARVLAYELATADEPLTALTRYEQSRRPTTDAVVLANRRMHQAGRAAATRSTGELARSGMLGTITDTYRETTGADVAALNDRASLTPTRR